MNYFLIECCYLPGHFPLHVYAGAGRPHFVLKCDISHFAVIIYLSLGYHSILARLPLTTEEVTSYDDF